MRLVKIVQPFIQVIYTLITELHLIDTITC